VNHISPASDEFQDFLEKGDKSKTAEMWIDWEKFWPNGTPPSALPHPSSHALLSIHRLVL